MRKQKWSRSTAPFYFNYNILGGCDLGNSSPTEVLRTLLNFLCARFSFFWLSAYSANHPHLLCPQDAQVMQPSTMRMSS